MTVNKTDIVVSEGGDIIHGGLHPPGAHIHELDLNHASMPSLSSIVTEPNQVIIFFRFLKLDGIKNIFFISFALI